MIIMKRKKNVLSKIVEESLKIKKQTRVQKKMFEELSKGKN